jgi:hypothetical protein
MTFITVIDSKIIRGIESRSKQILVVEKQIGTKMIIE